MVKDRDNNDKLLVCAEEKRAGYLWKTTDGKVDKVFSYMIIGVLPSTKKLELFAFLLEKI